MPTNRFAAGGLPTKDVQTVIDYVRGGDVSTNKAAEAAIWVAGYAASFIPEGELDDDVRPVVGSADTTLTAELQPAVLEDHLTRMLDLPQKPKGSAGPKGKGRPKTSASPTKADREAMKAFPWAALIPLLLPLIQRLLDRRKGNEGASEPEPVVNEPQDNERPAARCPIDPGWGLLSPDSFRRRSGAPAVMAFRRAGPGPGEYREVGGGRRQVTSQGRTGKGNPEE
jgi:hypothetical protein